MALKVSIASGNLTSASTWATIDSTSLLNSETGQTTITTSYVSSSSFTPGAITIDAIGVKLASRLGTTGTMSVRLADAGVAVAGTTVTIDVVDLPNTTAADLNGGWIFFKLAAPVTLTVAVAYTLQATTSSASQVSLHRDATAANYSRMLRTTTTGALAAGDDFIVAGEYTGSGTSFSFNVTQNETTSTDYGAASTSLVTPAVSICSLGTLTTGKSASTNYLLKISGNIIIYSGGTLDMGTSGAPVPSTSTSTIQMDCATNVGFGLLVRNGGTLNTYGTKSFNGVTPNHFTILTADEAAGQTVIGPVLDTTGWSNGDDVCSTSTSRTATESELSTISTVDSATQFTLSSGLVNAHSGTNDANGDIRCRIGNLTRNVKIFGASASLQAWMKFDATSVVNLNYTEIKWMGSATASKRGIDIGTTTGSLNIFNCAIRNFEVTSSNITVTGSTSGNYTIDKCVFYNVASGFVNAQTTGTWTITNNLFCRTGANNWVTLSDVGGTFSNNHINAAGAISSAFGLAMQTDVGGTIGTISDIDICACNGNGGMSVANAFRGTISNIRTYRNNSTNASSAGFHYGATSVSPGDVFTVTNLTSFGNNGRNVTIASGTINMINPNIQAGSTLAATIGIEYGGAVNATSPGMPIVSVYGGNIGTVTTHSTGDLSCANTGVGTRSVFYGVTFGSSTELSTPTNIGFGAYITSLKHDGVVGVNKSWVTNGRTSGGATIESDTAIYSSASPSIRMYPGSATLKLESMVFAAAVNSGNTLTASVKVRESVVGDGTDYNGNRIRLMLKRNDAAGITADTVIATATASSQGAFETISGTTPSVTDDAMLEFYVDCDGTTGWINIDDFSCTAENPNGTKHWFPSTGGALMMGYPATGGSAGTRATPFVG